MNESDELAEDAEDWLDDARWRLALKDVARPVVDDILAEARVLIAETGEPPTELFGPPEEWADEQIAERRRDGLPLVVPDPAASWRDVPVLGMYAAAGTGVVVLLHSLFNREWQLEYDLGLLGFPVVMGLVTMTVLTVWEKTLSRRSLAVAVAAGTGVVAGGVALLGLLVWLGRDHLIATASPWYVVLLVLACALLGRLFDSLLPEDAPRAWITPRTDDEWLAVLAGVLRLRADMPEERVRTIVAEAQAHCAEAGSTLQEEFGRPEDYAAQFPPDEIASTRRKAWAYTAISGLAVILVLIGSKWVGAILMLLWGARAVREWRRLRRQTSAVSPRPPSAAASRG
ncbi:hypothetical protein [Nocardioides gilvus]|uniref:hypothetical protein n=1 Tax=Nocardioides gilvus TaxID=1735589 RepID=UPI000D7452E4|nr:hypothetical protein [Nocardioides gilvus]